MAGCLALLLAVLLNKPMGDSLVMRSKDDHRQIKGQSSALGEAILWHERLRDC